MDKRVGIPNIGNIEQFRQYTDAIFSSGILTNNGPS
jgi:hypothetical protein